MRAELKGLLLAGSTASTGVHTAHTPPHQPRHERCLTGSETRRRFHTQRGWRWRRRAHPGLPSRCRASKTSRSGMTRRAVPWRSKSRTRNSSSRCVLRVSRARDTPVGGETHDNTRDPCGLSSTCWKDRAASHLPCPPSRMARKFARWCTAVSSRAGWGVAGVQKGRAGETEKHQDVAT